MKINTAHNSPPHMHVSESNALFSVRRGWLVREHNTRLSVSTSLIYALRVGFATISRRALTDHSFFSACHFVTPQTCLQIVVTAVLYLFTVLLLCSIILYPYEITMTVQIIVIIIRVCVHVVLLSLTQNNRTYEL